MPDGMWESDDYANTQFRFDKNEPFTERLMVNSYKSVVSFDKLLMSKVFKNVFEVFAHDPAHLDAFEPVGMCLDIFGRIHKNSSTLEKNCNFQS